MDRTFACQFALAYRSPLVSAGKPHGAIGSLHIAAPPLQAPRTDDIRACRGRGTATPHRPDEAGNIARNPNAIHPITSSLRLSGTFYDRSPFSPPYGFAVTNSSGDH